MNLMYFKNEDSKQLLDFISLLMSQSHGSDFYNDIHIKPDSNGAFTLEWTQVPWSDEYCGGFEFVDDDEVICRELTYPDDTFEYVPSGFEDEYLEAWGYLNKKQNKEHCNKQKVELPLKFTIDNSPTGETGEDGWVKNNFGE